MIQRGERLRFTLKPRKAVGVACEGLGQDLDRHVAIQSRIARPIHLPHPAFADPGRDAVDAETCAGCEGQRCRDYMYYFNLYAVSFEQTIIVPSESNATPIRFGPANTSSGLPYAVRRYS